jgi:SAM-dependent methyltransferase
MKPNVKDFVQIISISLPITDPVFEFGSLQVPDQIGFSDLRPFFPNNEYIGCDMRQGPGVDKILNLHDIDLPSESVGTILCFDTLEHVEFPRKALEEMHRVLKPNGIAVITSLMNFPIHEYPHDYWRFTPEAFKSILKPFQNSFVGFQGDPNFPHTVVGIGFKGDVPDLSEFEIKYYEWQTKERKSIQDFFRQITPPFLLPCLILFVKRIRILLSNQ